MPITIYPSAGLANSTYGAAYSPFAAPKSTVTTASSATVLSPAGFYFVNNGAQNSVQYTPNAGSNYFTLIGASTGGMVYSDGTSVQITNTSTGGTASTYVQILGDS